MRMNKVIRDYIKQNGLRLTFVADRSGIDMKKFSRLLTCKQKMTTEEYEAICEKGLNVSPAFFYGVKFSEKSNSA